MWLDSCQKDIWGPVCHTINHLWVFVCVFKYELIRLSKGRVPGQLYITKNWCLKIQSFDLKHFLCISTLRYRLKLGRKKQIKHFFQYFWRYSLKLKKKSTRNSRCRVERVGCPACGVDHEPVSSASNGGSSDVGSDGHVSEQRRKNIRTSIQLITWGDKDTLSQWQDKPYAMLVALTVSMAIWTLLSIKIRQLTNHRLNQFI